MKAFYQVKIIKIIFLLIITMNIIVYSQERTALNIQAKNINVELNRNIETLAIVYYLAEGDNFGYTKYTRTKIEEYFSYYKNHPVIEVVRSTNCWMDVLFYPMLYYSSFPTPRKMCEIPDDVYRWFSKDDIPKAKITIDGLINALSDFYRYANVDAFLMQNKEMYDSIIAETKRNIPQKELVVVMEKYYGKENLSYTIIPSPMLGSGWNFGPRVITPNGQKLFYIVAPSLSQEDTSSSNYGFSNKVGISEGSVHEFGHSFVNPLVDKYRKKVEKYSYLLNPIKEELRKQGYDTWLTATHEHIIRTGEIRISYALQDSARANRLREHYVTNKKFIYIPILEEGFSIYEQNRNKYKSFEDFFPELIGMFSKIDTTKKGY